MDAVEAAEADPDDVDVSGAGAGGVPAVEVGWLGTGACAGVAVGAASGGLGFETPECRSTGGELSSSSPRGTVGDAFLLDLAASASAVCQVPSAIHSFVF